MRTFDFWSVDPALLGLSKAESRGWWWQDKPLSVTLDSEAFYALLGDVREQLPWPLEEIDFESLELCLIHLLEMEGHRVEELPEFLRKKDRPSCQTSGCSDV